MANDRLYIICQCGVMASLYIYYPNGGYLAGGLESFLKHHSLNCANSASRFPATFHLIWESEASTMTHSHVKKEDCDLCSGAS